MDDQDRAVPPMAAPNGSEDEWEYEYSMTEKESHYVTMDLSIPEYLDRRNDHVVHNTRGGYSSWRNPLLASNGDKNDQDKILPLNDNEDEDFKDEHEIEEDEEVDETQVDPPTRRRMPLNVAHAMRVPPKLHTEDPKEIQILDLHADKPIISYRGTIFTGAWSSPIGTELIFTPHDDKDPQNILRHLPQNVDLLGASSARITCTPTEHTRIKPPGQEDRMRKVRQINQFAIPMYSDTYGLRQPQAHFIETLMAIKKRRGEIDEVTVFGADTKQDKVHNDAEEERTRKRKARAGRGQKKRYAKSQERKGRPPPRPREKIEDASAAAPEKGLGENGGEVSARTTEARQGLVPTTHPATLSPAIMGVEDGVRQT